MGSWIHLVLGRVSPISIHCSVHGVHLAGTRPHLLSPLGMEEWRLSGEL